MDREREGRRKVAPRLAASAANGKGQPLPTWCEPEVAGVGRMHDSHTPKPGLGFASLEHTARQMADNQAAHRLDTTRPPRFQAT